MASIVQWEQLMQKNIQWMHVRLEETTVFRSACVGVLATVTDLAALTLLTSVAGLHVRIASVPALALGIVVQFVGNKLFAFRDRDPRWRTQAIRFAGVEALGFIANLALFDGIVRVVVLPPVVLRLVTTNVVYFCVCLPLWGRVFSKNNKSVSEVSV
jgi:putative flippase GtrA